MTSHGPPRPAAVHFDIGRITLHGFSAAEKRRFASSLEASLAELGASAAVSWPGQRVMPRLVAGGQPRGASPEDAAGLVASALRGAIAERPGGRV